MISSSHLEPRPRRFRRLDRLEQLPARFLANRTSSDLTFQIIVSVKPAAVLVIVPQLHFNALRGADLAYDFLDRIDCSLLGLWVFPLCFGPDRSFLRLLRQ